MQITKILLVCVLIILAISCKKEANDSGQPESSRELGKADKPAGQDQPELPGQEAIIGKWARVGDESGVYREFTTEGKLNIVGQKSSVSLDLEIVDDSTFIIKDQEGHESTVKYHIKGDQMTTTDKNGKTEEFVRYQEML